MYDTAERVRRVKLRIKEQHRKRENCLLCSLFALSTVLSISLMSIVIAIRGSGIGGVPGPYGTMLMYEDAGGYVLVAVIAFAAAVVITALCIRYRERIKKSLIMEEAKKMRETEKRGLDE